MTTTAEVDGCPPSQKKILEWSIGIPMACVI